MNSHAHVILELPAPKEVSMIWDLNLSASFSSQAFSHVAPGVGNVSRPPIRRLIDVVPVLSFSFLIKRERDREREREREREKMKMKI